jgi:flavodoxin
MKTIMQKPVPVNLLLLAFMVGCLIVCCRTSFAQEIKTTVAASTASTDTSTKPFVVYYSRTGKARMVATALKNQLGCEMGEIVSHSKKGVFTIMLDQLFNRDDCQEPFAANLKAYNPIIIVTPVWFMRLSSPARTFIKTADLKGKDAYIVTTSGGPMPESRKKAFNEFAAKHGLTVKGVVGLQIGKKTQADFDKEIKGILENLPLKQESAKQR